MLQAAEASLRVPLRIVCIPLFNWLYIKGCKMNMPGLAHGAWRFSLKPPGLTHLSTPSFQERCAVRWVRHDVPTVVARQPPSWPKPSVNLPPKMAGFFATTFHIRAAI